MLNLTHGRLKINVNFQRRNAVSNCSKVLMHKADETGCWWWWLVAYRPFNRLVNLRDGSAETVVCVATLRQKLQIKLALASSHSILTPGQPVPALSP